MTIVYLGFEFKIAIIGEVSIAEMDGKATLSKRWAGVLSAAMYMFCSISMILSNKVMVVDDMGFISGDTTFM